MKSIHNIYTLLITMFTILPQFDFAQTWIEMQSEASNQYLESTDIAVDRLGNIYVSGDLTGDSYLEMIQFIH